MRSEGAAVTAGRSAMLEARRAEALARAHMIAARAHQARAERFTIGARSEARVAATLSALEFDGWRVVADLRWSARGTANIDIVLIGGGGVFVIDVKNWAEVRVEGGQLLHGQADEHEALDTCRDAAAFVSDMLIDTGLAPGEVVPVMAFDREQTLDVKVNGVWLIDASSLVAAVLRRGSRLSAEAVERIADHIEAEIGHPEAPTDAVVAVVPEPVQPTLDPDTLFDVDELTEAVLEGARRAPIESWMTFLPKDQRALVRRLGAGPASIRGAAGTGKTVVALHHAVRMARTTGGRVLFTTFVKTLPPVLASLTARMAPDVADQIEFVHLHGWASALLRSVGTPARGSRAAVTTAFNRAWADHGRDSVLSRLGATHDYWREEVDHVIKGRGLTVVGEYHRLARVGRRLPLNREQRDAVWTVYAAYEARLRDREIHDANDVLALALHVATQSSVGQVHSAVIADEVQDISCTGLRLLKQLSDGGRRLLLVGDSEQQIYPGGYTLAEAGISVAGRSSVLRVNYRNHPSVLDAALEALGGAGSTGVDKARATCDSATTAVVDGDRVARVWADTTADLRGLAVHRIRQLLDADEDIAGIAVLLSTNDGASAMGRALDRARIPWVALKDYSGRPVAAVKVGTVQRAKGLDFAHVLHFVLAATTDDDDASRERAELACRSEYVARSRARDTLWLGQLRSSTSLSPSSPQEQPWPDAPSTEPASPLQPQPQQALPLTA